MYNMALCRLFKARAGTAKEVVQWQAMPLKGAQARDAEGAARRRQPPQAVAKLAEGCGEGI